MDDDAYIALQVLMMPRDTNGLAATRDNTFNLSHLSIFGGVLLSYIDQAGAIGARRAVLQAGGPRPWLVTVAVNRVEFKKPVLVGDVVRFKTSTVRWGRTSITVHVDVEAERGAEVEHVAEAELVFVGIDPSDRRPVPLRPESPEPPALPGMPKIG
jgi:acyl-CoA thioesterase YciA